MSGGAGSVKLGIARTEWSKGRKRRVPGWSGWSWLRLESERGCVSPAHGEHNTVRRAVQRAAREMIPERARGLLFWGLMCPALGFQRLHALCVCCSRTVTAFLVSDLQEHEHETAGVLDTSMRHGRQAWHAMPPVWGVRSDVDRGYRQRRRPKTVTYSTNVRGFLECTFLIARNVDLL